MVRPKILAAALLAGALGALPAAEPTFLRGDADRSGALTVTDPVLVLWYAFRGGLAPIECLDAADADDSSAIDLTDAILLLRHLFAGGPPPAGPYPLFGADGTGDGLDCQFPGARGGSAVYLCIDRSGSASGSWTSVQEEIVQEIRSLRPDEEFSLLFFDASLVAFPPSPWPATATEAMKAAATEMVLAMATGEGSCPRLALLEARDGAAEISVRERNAGFAGTIVGRIDRAGTGRIRYDYASIEEEILAREVGVRILLRPGCEEPSWRRWAEWEGYPDDPIGRTEGRARARRDPGSGPDTEGARPTWPWAQDQTELDTNDFRGIKFHIFEATLAAPDGTGIGVHGPGGEGIGDGKDGVVGEAVHVRACLAPEGVWLHILARCGQAPVVHRKGDRIRGEFAVSLTGPR